MSGAWTLRNERGGFGGRNNWIKQRWGMKFRDRRLSGILAAYCHLTENSAGRMLAEREFGFRGREFAVFGHTYNQRVMTMKKWMTKTLIAGALLCAAFGNVRTSLAATYYVSTAGNNAV